MLTFNSFLSEEHIAIQYLDATQNWRTVSSGVANNSFHINKEMENLKKRYPNFRVRAVGMKSKKIYDILT